MHMYSSECCVSTGSWLAAALLFFFFFYHAWHCKVSVLRPTLLLLFWFFGSGFYRLGSTCTQSENLAERLVRELQRRLPGLTLFFLLLVICSPARPLLHCYCIYSIWWGEERREEEEEVGVGLNFWHSLVSLDQLGESGCCGFIKLQLNSWMSLRSHNRWESEN